jgi:hypothetical protein
MKKIVVAAAMFAALSPGAVAEPGAHLEPERSFWPGVEAQLGFDPAPYIKVFAEAFGNDVLVRMIRVATVTPDHGAVMLKERNGVYRIAYLRTVKPMPYRTAHPDGNTRVERCEAVVEPALANSIFQVWHKSLMDVRYPVEPYWGLDGFFFHFGLRNRYGDEMAGKIWNPPAGSVPRLLVDVAEAMGAYCKTPNAATTEALASAVSALASRVNAQH